MRLRSGTPYWLLADGLIATYPPLDRDERCDVAVVGAGVSGALAAYRLACEGADVVVLDRRDVATGSTVASTGLLQYETDTELHDLARRVGVDDAVRCWRLGAEAVVEVGRIAAALGDDCHYASRDTLYVASRERDVRRLRRELALRRAHGFDVELWEAGELSARTSIRAPAALASRGGAEVDAYRLTHRLLAAARALGARVHDRTTVTAYEAAGTAVRLATDRGPRVAARRVVFAAGYESGSFLPRRTGRLRSTFALASEPLARWDGWPARMLVWESARPYFYVRATADGRAVVGGLDTRGAADHRLPGLLARRTDRLARRFGELFPDIPFEPGYAWAGTFGESEDGMPYIGAHPDVPGALFSLCYGGNGITFGAIGARIVTELALGRPSPDAALFRFDR